MEFRRIQTIVEAEQFLSGKPLPFRGAACRFNGKKWYVTTKYGDDVDIEYGDWIIRDGSGFYPCKPGDFENTFEEA
jgi:hypothetical protein